jgi:hypothetical protein
MKKEYLLIAALIVTMPGLADAKKDKPIKASRSNPALTAPKSNSPTSAQTPIITAPTVEVEEVLPPETIGNILAALNTQKLQETETKGNFSSPKLEFDSRGTRLSGYVTKDGIPGKHGEGALSVDDILPRGYNSVQMIELVLEERMEYKLGPRLFYLESGIRSTLKISGDRADEEALRETLNRGLDIMSLVLPISGSDPDARAQWGTNFYRRILELAAGMQHNQRRKILRVGPVAKDDKDTPFTDEDALSLNALRSAKYGQMLANLLYKFSSQPGSRAGKAVMLMRLVGYLGHDLNEDFSRREEDVARTITDIYRLQTDPPYTDVVAAISRGRSPTSEQMSALRSRVATIIAKLPERLGKAPDFTLENAP